MKRVHIASFPDAQFGKSTEAKNKGGRSRLKSVPAKGCVQGERTAGTSMSPDRWLAPRAWCRCAPRHVRGPYLDAARSDRFGYAPPASAG